MKISIKFKFFLLTFLAAFILFVSFVVVFDRSKEIIADLEEQEIEKVLTSINNELQSKIDIYKGDLLIISSLPQVQDLLNSEEDQESKISSVEDLFLDFSRVRSDYLQIRYIDETGQEIVKVNRENANSVVNLVTESDLQNKKDRYYFQESVKLSSKNIFTSVLDLNVEFGQVEVPYKPTIRFAVPVFDQNQENRGIIITNIFAQPILDIVQSSPYNKTYLLDQEGYYLFHSQIKSAEWGRDLGTDIRFDSVSSNSGFFKEFFRNNDFLDHAVYQNGIYKHFFYKVNYNSLNSDQYWLITTTILDTDFFGRFYELRKNSFILFGGVSILIALLFLAFTYFILRPIDFFKKTLRQLKLGDYTGLVPLAGHDELGDIATEMNSLIKQIKKQEKEKHDFISSASHQLRTPTSAVSMHLDLLAEEFSKKKSLKEYQSQIEEISNNNRRLAAVMEDLLKYLEIGNSYFATDLTKVKVKKTILDIINSFSSQLIDKKIKVKIEISNKLVVKVDEIRFKYLLLNLIANAIAYSNEAGEIYIKVKKDKDNSVLFEISDQGIGIPQADQIQIFDKFFRAKNAYLKESVGSGLGLVISKTIVEGHGGKIWFKSKEGKGSTFYFTIFTL